MSSPFDWAGAEEPNELERGYAVAIFDVLREARDEHALELAIEFLARCLAAHRVRSVEVATGRAAPT